MTFDEAWAAHIKRQSIIPPNQQTFRHGWNEALVAAAKACEDALAFNPDDPGETYAAIVRKLEVEVQT